MQLYSFLSINIYLYYIKPPSKFIFCTPSWKWVEPVLTLIPVEFKRTPSPAVSSNTTFPLDAPPVIPSSDVNTAVISPPPPPPPPSREDKSIDCDTLTEPAKSSPNKFNPVVEILNDANTNEPLLN